MPGPCGRLLKCCRISLINHRMPKKLIWWVWIHLLTTTKLEWIYSWIRYAMLEISMIVSKYVLSRLVPNSCTNWLRCLTQMDQYMALSKRDLQINITMNEVYNTQSLLQQHIDSLVHFFFTLMRGQRNWRNRHRLETTSNICEFCWTNWDLPQLKFLEKRTER